MVYSLVYLRPKQKKYQNMKRLQIFLQRYLLLRTLEDISTCKTCATLHYGNISIN